MSKYVDLKGSCQCGSVQYKVSGDLMAFYLCHCSRCRKDTGSAHAANIFVQEQTFEYAQGEEHVSHFNVPNTLHTKHFCQLCGSPVAAKDAGSKMVVVPAGSLDDSPELTPTGQIFFDSRPSWVDKYRSDSCEKFAELPQ